MALTSTEGHLLPCGRRLEDVWDRLDARPATPVDKHERSCPHCQTARSSLQALAEATRAVCEDTSLTPSPTLQGRIMSAVRAEVRRGARLPLPPGELGPVDVSEQAVATVLRFAADTIDGVRARRCRLQRTEAPTTGEPVDTWAGGTSPVRVDISIAIRYSRSTTRELVETVRARVAAVAAAQVGLNVFAIDIEVEDVYRDGG